MGCTGMRSIKVYIWVEDKKNTKNASSTPNYIFPAFETTTLRLLKFFILEKTSIQIED